MLTPIQIASASPNITQADKDLWLVLFDQNDKYRAHVIFFSDDASTKIDEINGTTRAKMLNALMAQIIKVGGGGNYISIRGDRDALWWDQHTELMAIVTDAFYVLYTIAEDPSSLDGNIGVIPELGLWGSYAASGQRPQYTGIEGETRSSFVKPRKFTY